MRINSFLHQANFINGQWIQTTQDSQIKVLNPANGEQLGAVPFLTREETRNTIDAAALAFKSWKKTTATERSGLMQRLSELMMEHKSELAELLTLEMGKPLNEAAGEISIGAAYIKWFAEEARRIYGDLIPSPWQDKRIVVTKEPVGIVAAITPWNFPNSMIARKLGAALAAGCTLVIKPASQTPYSALAFADLCEKAGFPAGVVNVITGKASDIAEEFCTHPSVRKITFTGSTFIGKKLAANATSNMKRISMELGGNAPFIVFDDADLESAVDGAIVSKFRNAGQTCVCANRILVQSSVYDEFIEKFVAATKRLKLGNGLETGTTIGPLIDSAAVNKVQELIDDSINKGGRLVLGDDTQQRQGSFIKPTIVAEATQDMKVAKEEIFGPFAPVFMFDTEEQAVAMANDTEYGLACYFYSQNQARIWRVMEALEYGMVGVNEGLIATEVAPFGGVKDSGMGIEGSKYGLNDYLNTKYVCLGGLTDQ